MIAESCVTIILQHLVLQEEVFLHHHRQRYPAHMHRQEVFQDRHHPEALANNIEINTSIFSTYIHFQLFKKIV